MNTRVLRLMGAAGFLCAAPAFADPAVFTFDTSDEGWTNSGAAAGMSNVGGGGGVLTFDYITPTGAFDPILDSPGGLNVSTGVEHWLRLDIDITTAGAAGPQTIQVFFDDGNADGNGGYNEADSRTFTVTPNLGMQTIVFDMALPQGGRDDFDGTVVDFRIDPGNNEAELVAGTCDISLIALTDDTDFDSIEDDAEIAAFGDIDTADASSDFDGDGISDRIEISLGLDPTFDEGATVPVGGSLWVLLGLGAVGLAYTRRR